MKTLRQDLLQLKTQGKLAELTEIREVIEDTRENVWQILQKKQDTGVAFDKEMDQIEQLNSNLALVTEAITYIKHA